MGVRTSSPHTLRVNRLAAAIDMIAAGTSAPIAMAERQKPANHSGNILRNRSGTTELVSLVAMPAVMAA